MQAWFMPAKVAQTLLMTKFQELKHVMPSHFVTKLSIFVYPSIVFTPSRPNQYKGKTTPPADYFSKKQRTALSHDKAVRITLIL